MWIFLLLLFLLLPLPLSVHAEDLGESDASGQKIKELKAKGFNITFQGQKFNF